MGRSTIVSELLLFACFVVLIKIPEITTTPARPLYTKDGFLAGENTPVWLAEPKLPYDATYKRIITKTPIVGWAVQRWKNRGSHFPLRVIRSVDDSGNLTSSEELYSLRDAGEDRFYSPSRFEKRTTAEDGVLYPSILVVMSYDSVERPHDSISSWFYDELVLYALAFWGTVDNSLRNIQNPRVSLRIAGIVITDIPLASPYLRWNYDETFVKALPPMMNHWRSVAQKNPDFPVGSYDIVVHMTDMLPAVPKYPLNSKKKAILGVSSQGPPCNLPDKIAGVIVYDDLAFNGLDRTIAQMIKVLGGNEPLPKVDGSPLRSWTKEILDPISVALKSASCMSAPKEHHPPGAPVVPILAGEIIPSKQQCELSLKDQNAVACWKSTLPNTRTTCQSLFCSKLPSSPETCSQVGFPLDGTFCNEDNTKICSGGECVDKIPEISSEVTTAIVTPRYAKDGFLAGEDTPVWVAESKNPNEVTYKRIVTVTPIVLWAIKRWKKMGSLPLRVMRSVDDRGNFSSPEEFDALWDSREDSFYDPRPVEKRSTAGNEVLYPSILVVMSYDFTKSSRGRISRGSYDELVLYALAFWGGIDHSLRNIQNPRVSLRIAGIVIADKRESSPYLQGNPGEERFVSALSPMVDHWRSVAKKNPDFPVGSYDIVVHMTDTHPEENPNKKAILGVSSQGPPCDLPDKIAGVIVYDNLAFNGLDTTVGQMIKVLGGNDQSSKDYRWPRTSWTREILNPISDALKGASCMSAPKEHHPPGAPVETILPGQVIASKQQCEILIPDMNAWPCWKSKLPHKRTTCQSLFCSKYFSSAETCSQVGFPLDGTVCNDEKSKICLDGECVDKISAVTTPAPKSLHAKDGFLAGADTPVWLAQIQYPNDVTYKRIVSTKPIVLRSVENWEKADSFPLRVERSVDNSRNFTSLEELDALWDAREDHFYSPSPVDKRSTSDNGVVYPSILVVMSYFPVNSPAGRTSWTHDDLVLYALAYWGTVDNALRNIQNPRVSLRIAGIVITETRDASPYLLSYTGEQTFVKALSPMMDHWKSVAKKNPDFPVGSYDIVVHMTDILAQGYLDEKTMTAVSSQGPPCNLPDKRAGVIVYDNLAFNGLDRTIRQMIKVLGGNEPLPKVNGSPRVRWTMETLNPISDALKTATCMSAPKEHHPPGAPVAPILAGQIMSSKEQCKMSGYSQYVWPCWTSTVDNKRTTCQSLFCSNHPYEGETCTQAGFPLDGTYCNYDKTQICVDGECVEKDSTRISRSAEAVGRLSQAWPRSEGNSTPSRVREPEMEMMQFFFEVYQQLSYQT